MTILGAMFGKKSASYIVIFLCVHVATEFETWSKFKAGLITITWKNCLNPHGTTLLGDASDAGQ